MRTIVGAALSAGCFLACQTAAVDGVPLDQPAAQSQEGLVVHEWGTYTSLQSSEGKSMDGLQHTEELLPAFVHMRDVGNPMNKGCERLPEAVNQKLETPVLYFYSAQPLDVRVKVDFPKGIISEWYPDASAFQPAIRAIAQTGGGSMAWQTALLPNQAIAQMPVAADSVWAPSRQVASAGLRSGAEEERFIFYRGLGRFEMPLMVTAASDGSLNIKNDSGDPISAAFLFSIGAEQAALKAIGPIPAHGAQETDSELPRIALSAYLDDAKSQVQVALEASGLYADEARAMVETWSRSYFLVPGLRVLYIAPRTWTDALLPIAIDPAPRDLVRTLVGRVEVMTPAEETAIVEAVKNAATGGPPFDLQAHGRFTEAKLHRAAELITPGSELGNYLQGLLAEASSAP